mmetsp:Transcript_12827/g.40515  ORF Transcript_12827/g.40515 Transcript_12827/m.40515 type:complete len:239 (+) Transcript_12827:225-941(+)
MVEATRDQLLQQVDRRCVHLVRRRRSDCYLGRSPSGQRTDGPVDRFARHRGVRRGMLAGHAKPSVRIRDEAERGVCPPFAHAAGDAATQVYRTKGLFVVARLMVRQADGEERLDDGTSDGLVTLLLKEVPPRSRRRSCGHGEEGQRKRRRWAGGGGGRAWLLCHRVNVVKNACEGRRRHLAPATTAACVARPLLTHSYLPQPSSCHEENVGGVRTERQRVNRRPSQAVHAKHQAMLGR